MQVSLKDALVSRLRNIGDLAKSDQAKIIAIVDETIEKINAAAVADPSVDLWQAAQTAIARVQTEEVIAGLRLHRRSQAEVMGLIFDAIKFGVAFV